MTAESQLKTEKIALGLSGKLNRSEKAVCAVLNRILVRQSHIAHKNQPEEA